MALRKNINESLVKNQPSAKSLLTMIFEIDKEIGLEDVELYHQFPLYIDETGEKSISTDVLFISQKYGVIIFKCIEYSERNNKIEINNIANNLNQLDKLIFSKILTNAPNLSVKRRELKINILPAIYLHNCDKKPNFIEWNDYEIITSSVELKNIILSNYKKRTNRNRI